MATKTRLGAPMVAQQLLLRTTGFIIPWGQTRLAVFIPQLFLRVASDEKPCTA